jgi:hypothetical protein
MIASIFRCSIVTAFFDDFSFVGLEHQIQPKEIEEMGVLDFIYLKKTRTQNFSGVKEIG